jgi:hypothetical protein
MTPDQADGILLVGGMDRAVANRIAPRVAAVASQLEATNGAALDSDLFWAVAVTAADAIWRSDKRAASSAARTAGRLAGIAG